MIHKLSRIALFAIPALSLSAAQAASEAPAGVAADGKGYAEVEWIRTPRPNASPPRVPANTEALAPMKSDSPSDWTVELADQTFYQTLLRWCRLAGWQLVWEADRDFPIDAQVTLQGNFLHALDQSMRSLRETDYPVQARVNPDTRVVRVVRYLLDGDRR